MDVSRAVFMASETDFDAWLARHGSEDREVLVAINKQASGKQTVTLPALQEVALCHGWVDTQIQRIDDERYAIRFVPRRSRSNWSPTNRELARRLLEQQRIRPAGLATLPDDL
jgi:uncharacterized protein YdeI (YjbR/CyaY-like superfamily)